jgi:hypothetical protein
MDDCTDLDWAFTCPASVTDDDLRAGYEILVARFRGEGAHLPLNTAFQLLIERTINSYIKLKHAERRNYKVSGGFEHAGQEKDYNVFVQGMLHEVNDMLRKNHPTADKEFVLQQVKDVILAVMGGIPDKATRDDLAQRFAVAFEQSGM